VLPDRSVADDGCNNHGDGDIGSWRSVQPAAAAATNRFFSPPRHRRAADEAPRGWSIRADWSPPPQLRSRAIQDAAYAPIDAYTRDTDVGDYVRRAAADL